MSPNFCILIPSKVFQGEKRFPEKLQAWLTEHRDEFYPGYTFPKSHVHKNYPLITLSEFQGRPDVHLDLPEKMYSRYHVLDWEFDFPKLPALQSLLSWLAEIYVYGEVGLLKYWSDSRKRFPAITVGSIEGSVLQLSASQLPLDKILFFPLTNFLIGEDST
jgi:hypothetical protein